MREGIIASALFHIVAIAVAITGLSPLRSESLDIPDIIPVELIDIEKLSSAPEPLQTKAEPEPIKPKLEKRVEATPPEETAAPLPPEVEAPRAKPEPPAIRQTANLTPRAKPRPPKRYDRQRITALLDKRTEEKKDQPDKNAKPVKDLRENLQISSRLADIDQQRLNASLRDIMRAQIERCWIVPAGAMDASDLTIRIRVFLNPDGSLARPPQIVDRQRMSQEGQGFYRAAAEGARRAVQKCAPLKLPVEHYEIWRASELIFDPRKILGG